MDAIYGTEKMRMLKENMIEQLSMLRRLKEGKPMKLLEDKSVEVRVVDPKEMEEEEHLLKELYMKDDLSLTVRVYIDRDNPGKVAREILDIAEVEGIKPKEENGKLVLTGIMLFTYYTSKDVLVEAFNGAMPVEERSSILEKGCWLYELFYPYEDGE